MRELSGPDAEDVPPGELLSFAAWCRRPDVNVVPHPPVWRGLRLTEEEAQRWRADPDGECIRAHDQWPKWLAAKVNWAAERDGYWPVLEFDLVLERGARQPRKLEHPGSARPDQRAPCPAGRQPWPRP